MISYSALAVGIWIIFATCVGLSNSFNTHKFFALYVLIPSALVILPWLAYDYGFWILFVALLGLASVLRWPLYYIGKFIYAKITGGEFVGPRQMRKK